MSEKETATLWVCTDCLMKEANDDLSGADAEMQAQYPAMSKLAGEDVSLGMTQDGHACGRENGSFFGECECETDPFSSSQCDGCGSPYAGERHALTLWLEANNA